MKNDISIKEALSRLKKWDEGSKAGRGSLAGRSFTDIVAVARLLTILDEDVNQLFNCLIFCMEKLEEQSKMTTCGYIRDWAGRCNKPCEEGKEFCEIHLQKKCWCCGEQAITHCPVSSSLMCGEPECVSHPHSPTHYKREV